MSKRSQRRAKEALWRATADAWGTVVEMCGSLRDELRGLRDALKSFDLYPPPARPDRPDRWPSPDWERLAGDVRRLREDFDRAMAEERRKRGAP